jgi:DNA-binding XRE family transcriptional regulator
MSNKVATPAMLRAFRAEFGLTQPDMVRVLGVSWQAISRWERGAQPIRHDRVLYLALQHLRTCYRRRARQRRAYRERSRAA